MSNPAEDRGSFQFKMEIIRSTNIFEAENVSKLIDNVAFENARKNFFKKKKKLSS